MFHYRTPIPIAPVDAPSACWRDTVPHGRIDDTAFLAAAHLQRAAYLKTLIRTRFYPHVSSRVLPVTMVLALGSAMVIVTYATFLSGKPLPAAAPALAAILLASALSSIAGFAFSAIAGVMLLHLMSDPVQVVEIMMTCSIAIQSLSVALLWREIRWQELVTFLAGGVIGLPVGVWLLLHLDPHWFRAAIGGLLTAYAIYGLLKPSRTIKSGSRAVEIGIGCLGGITGGLAGFPGAAVTIWCGMRGWDKQHQRGVYQPFILVMQVLALLLIQLVQQHAAHNINLGLNLQFVAVALIGTWVGLSVFKRLSNRSFALMVKVLLLVSGIGLLV